MQKCKVFCIPYAGLCNRISCLMSALYLSDHYADKFTIKVYWESSNDCKAYFDQLFIPIKRDNFRIARLQNWNLLFNRYTPNFIKQIYFDKIYIGGNNDVILNKSFHAKKIYIASYNKFIQFEYKTNIAEILQPQPQLENKILEEEKKIKDYCKQNQCKIIGIHIRRTDNQLAIKNSPVFYFLHKIEELHEKTKCCFYLSTDDDNLKEKIVQEYKTKGIKIFSHKSILKRNSLEGMEDAVIDLWLLGKCYKIIGSSNSSFSIWASRLYNTPLEINK